MELFFETIDDFLINWYFEHEKEFETPFQNLLSKKRFDLLHNKEHSSEEDYEYTKNVLCMYSYTLFKKKELDILKDYVHNFQDPDFVMIYKSRKELDDKFLLNINSKIDFF